MAEVDISWFEPGAKLYWEKEIEEGMLNYNEGEFVSYDEKKKTVKFTSEGKAIEVAFDKVY